jgi:hypothetical protein
MAFNAVKYLIGLIGKQMAGATKRSPVLPLKKKKQIRNDFANLVNNAISESMKWHQPKGVIEKRVLPALESGGRTALQIDREILQTAKTFGRGLKTPQGRSTMLRGFAGGIPKTIARTTGNLAIEYGETKRAGKINLLTLIAPGATAFGELYNIGMVKNPLVTENRLNQIREKGYSFAKFLNRLNDKVQKSTKTNMPKDEELQEFYNLGGSGSSVGVSVGLGLLTKSPAVAGLSSGFQQKASVYEEARMANKSPEEAQRISSTAGTIEGALEYVGFDKILNPVSRGFLGRTIARGGTEMIQESFQELGSNITARLTYNQQRNIFDNIGVAGTIGFIMGGGSGVGLSITEQNNLKTKLTENGLTDIEADYVVNKKLPGFIDEINKGFGAIASHLQQAQAPALSINELIKSGATTAKEQGLIETHQRLTKDLYRMKESRANPQSIKTAEKNIKRIEVRLKSLAQERILAEKGQRPMAGLAIQEVGKGQTTQPKLTETAEQAFSNMLGQFIKTSKETGTIRSKETGQRVGSAMMAWRNSGGGERGLNSFLSQLEGKYSTAKITPFKEQFVNKYGQKQFDELLNKPFKDQNLRPLEAGQLANTVRNIIEKGEIPSAKGRGGLPSKTLLLMRRVYGAEATKALSEYYKKPVTFKDIATEVISIPKALIASGEWSGIGRQGFTMIARRPWLLPKMIVTSVKTTFSAKQQQKIYDKMIADPDYIDAVKFKLPLTGINKELGGLQAGEEAFTQRFINKMPLWVPGAGQIAGIIRASNRAYETALDVGRFNSFKSMKKSLVKKGYNPKAEKYTGRQDKHGNKELTRDYKAFKDNAKVISYFSGRGDLGKFESIAGPLNTAIFSVRLAKSRVDIFTQPFNPKLSKTARVEAWKGLICSVAQGLTLMGLMSLWLGGVKKKEVEVEWNPISADFGKVRVGKHRWDVWGGHQQMVRAFAQFITGQYKSTTTGFVGSFKKEYGGGSRMDALLRFVEAKQSPGISLIVDMLRGEDFLGRPFNLKRALAERSIPMYWQDLNDALREMGPSELIEIGLPGFLGMGIQTYGASGQAGIREKIREGTITDEEWERAIADGTISEDPDEQARVVREAHMPEQVVAFSNMKTEEQLKIIPTFSDEQIKKAIWGATEDTIEAMKKGNPKKWAELGLDNVLYHKGLESKYRSEYKKRGLEPMEAWKQAYKTAKNKMKDPVFKQLRKIGYDWTFPTNKASGFEIKPSLYAKFAKEADEKIYNAYKAILKTKVRTYNPEIQRLILEERRDEIRRDLREKHFANYYNASDYRNDLIKRGVPPTNAEQMAIKKYLK